MTLYERLFHSVLFELGAIGVASVAVLALSSSETSTAVGAGVVMSLMAVVWNFVFNYFFDKIFTGRREARGFRLRLFHTLSFEGGLLIFTVPVLACMLNISLWQALLADIALTVLITFYSLIFNWIYDHIRIKLWAKSELSS